MNWILGLLAGILVALIVMGILTGLDRIARRDFVD
jgi:hypothetical protein